MIRKFVTLGLFFTAALFFLGACASQPKSREAAGGAWFPRCEHVDCEEPVAELHAPDGAVLSFETCMDGANREYSYRRSGEVWVLTSYTMTAAACPSGKP